MTDPAGNLFVKVKRVYFPRGNDPWFIFNILAIEQEKWKTEINGDEETWWDGWLCGETPQAWVTANL